MLGCWAAPVVLTVSGLCRADRDKVRKQIEQAGGRYSPSLSRSCSHLLIPVPPPSTDKLRVARSLHTHWGLKIVTPAWLAACVAAHALVAPPQPLAVLFPSWKFPENAQGSRAEQAGRDLSDSFCEAAFQGLAGQLEIARANAVDTAPASAPALDRCPAELVSWMDQPQTSCDSSRVVEPSELCSPVLSREGSDMDMASLATLGSIRHSCEAGASATILDDESIAWLASQLHLTENERPEASPEQGPDATSRAGADCGAGASSRPESRPISSRQSRAKTYRRHPLELKPLSMAPRGAGEGASTKTGARGSVVLHENLPAEMRARLAPALEASSVAVVDRRDAVATSVYVVSKEHAVSLLASDRENSITTVVSPEWVLQGGLQAPGPAYVRISPDTAAYIVSKSLMR